MLYPPLTSYQEDVLVQLKSSREGPLLEDREVRGGSIPLARAARSLQSYDVASIWRGDDDAIGARDDGVALRPSPTQRPNERHPLGMSWV